MTAACAHAPVPPSAAAAGVVTRDAFVSADGVREFVLYRPARSPSRGEQRALVVVLHGCAQSADDIARGTRMNEWAERDRFLVLYPEQPASAHPQRCWNWFLPSQVARGQGEAALLAALIDSVATSQSVTRDHVALAGMSAGAAMAADLAVAYPERYAALALHSGLPALSATDAASALRGMRAGARDDDVLGEAAVRAMGERARAIPVIVLHGSADKVVAPSNLRATARQWAYINGHTSGHAAPVETHLFEGVGHAWSGGSPNGSFTAPSGPDATALIVEFFRRTGVLAEPSR